MRIHLLASCIALSSLGCPIELPEGRFVCTRDDECPPTWVCVSERCYRRADASWDAAIRDGSIEDAPSAEVLSFDAPSDALGCSVAADCDDGNSCTVESCMNAGCEHVALDCDDDIPCTLDGCSGVLGCSHVPSDALCSANRSCVPSAAGADGNGCVASSGCTDASMCDDGLFCTEDLCQLPAGVCMHRPLACPEDTNPCTTGVACDEVTDRCVPSFANATTECRAAAGFCDVPESCTGTSAACPPDAFAGSSRTCRDAAHDCDGVERCSGSSPVCPPDLPASDGTPCDRRCGYESCSAGVCAGGSTCGALQECLCDVMCGNRGAKCS